MKKKKKNSNNNKQKVLVSSQPCVRAPISVQSERKPQRILRQTDRDPRERESECKLESWRQQQTAAASRLNTCRCCVASEPPSGSI